MTISRLMTAAAVAGLVVSSASMAADAQRPTVTSYAAPAAVGPLAPGVRAGARTRRGSSLDGPSDMVMGGGAGAGAYFLIRALDNNNNNNDPTSPQ